MAGEMLIKDHEWLPTLIKNSLMNYSGVTTIEELADFTVVDILRLPNCGKLTVQKIEGALAEMGLSLKLPTPEKYQGYWRGKELVTFPEGIPTCAKCGSDDIDLKYRQTGWNSCQNERMEFKCLDCGFDWRTKTKDASPCPTP